MVVMWRYGGSVGGALDIVCSKPSCAGIAGAATSEIGVHDVQCILQGEKYTDAT